MASSSASATTAAERALGALALLAALSCARVEVGGVPAAETAEPLVRVGLPVRGSDVAVGGGSALLLTGADGGGLVELAEGLGGTLVAGPGGVRMRTGGVQSATVAALTIRPRDSAGTVRIEGRDYRGEVVVSPVAAGLLAVNLVPLEAYVAGVVNAEMGSRPAGDLEAVYAQAVISRTVAVRALGRHRSRGYDVLSTVADQAYGGVGSETQMGWDAVRATRGQVVTFGGSVIEAFFHSTCGGRTAAVEESFSGVPQPYLVSINDRDPAGQAYCALSPRFRWQEEWTGEQLARALAETRGATGLDPAIAEGLSAIDIGGRTPSGRVAEVLVSGAGRVHPIAGQNPIRQALRPLAGGILRSTRFTIQLTRSGERLARVVITGGGNGHGVGMCQWGAVGRARAGASYREILSAYFPGTEITRLY